MNVYDSARMTDVLMPLGYQVTDHPDAADMVILNTCHIREKAAEKVYSELGRLNRIKQRRQKQGLDMILAVAGCVAQAEGDEILSRAPYVDLVFGPQTYHDLPEMIARLSRQGGAAVLNTNFTVEEKFDNLPETSAESGVLEGVSAFLTIQEGCDKFCTFCVVPYTRGAEFSRGPSEILKEALRLVNLNVREVTLLGQNVNNYHGLGDDGCVWGLGRLIRAIGEIPGIERIRYMTSYPADVDDALIATHRDVDQLMPFLHLPVQSGSNRILKAMNRRHSADDYRELVERLRSARPDLALSSDFIIGFPGETEDDFKATMKLVEDIGFSQAYSFKYSPRPGTPAATLQNQIDETLKSERLAILQTALKAQQLAFNKSCAGSVMPVLLDRPGRNAGQMVGRSPYMQPVHVTVPEKLFGTIVDLRIEEGKANSLVGSLPDEQNWASRDPNQQKVNAA
jgi:tRNA-2-methylthio-N6-dimethylallyladenosine synthase